MKKTCFLTLAILSSSSAFAEKEEHREHGAHEHGHGQLSVIAEKKDLLLAIETPANNVFGFEHEPKSKEQKEIVHEAIEALEDFASLIVLDSDAKCSVKKVDVNQPFADEHDEHKDHDDHGHHKEAHDDHKDEHAEHKHDDHKDEHAEHKHDDHKDEHAEHKHDDHKDEHAEHKHDDHKDEHGHDEHKHDEHEESVHSDVDLEVAIHCENEAELSKMDLTPFFKRFPLFLELETKAITNGKQTALVLNKDKPVFSFKN